VHWRRGESERIARMLTEMEKFLGLKFYAKPHGRESLAVKVNLGMQTLVSLI
jgi:hypothetical protein